MSELGFAGYRITRVVSDDDVTFEFAAGAGELLFNLLSATVGATVLEVETATIAPALATLTKNRAAYERQYGAATVAYTQSVLKKMRDQSRDHGDFIVYEILYP